MSNPLDSIVQNDLCCGCGVCAAVCPEQRLTMKWNKNGEYSPYKKEACFHECGLCFKVCPFGNDNPNEDEIGQRWFADIPGIQHNAETGYHLVSFVGHSEKHRQTGASGGMATWLLTTLLSNSEIDAAICVSPSNEPGTLFKYSVMRDAQSIESSSGSAYYPVQLSDVLTYIVNTPGRYAITALPCFAKAIRLAQLRNKVLKERIVFIVGITCGQMKSKHYTDYLVGLSGMKGKVSKVHYRGKDEKHPASNYYFSCYDDNGGTRKLFWNEGVSEAWLSRWFTLNSCNYCDDIFAECADVVCMDAWLPEYSSDWKGTSLISVRSPQILKLLRGGINKKELDLALIPIDKVIGSQSGLVTNKRHDLVIRLFMAHKEDRQVPRKRVHSKRVFNPIDVSKARLSKSIQSRSKDIFLRHQTEDEFDPIPFHKELGPYQKKMDVLQRATSITHVPTAAIKKLRRQYS